MVLTQGGGFDEGGGVNTSQELQSFKQTEEIRLKKNLWFKMEISILALKYMKKVVLQSSHHTRPFCQHKRMSLVLLFDIAIIFVYKIFLCT